MDTVSYELYKSELQTLQKHLRRALVENDEFQAKLMFMRLGNQVPFDAFRWITLQPKPSLPLLDLLFHRQVLCDDFINYFLDHCSESDLTVFSVMGVLVDTRSHFSRNDLYFIQELLTNGDPCNASTFPKNNIHKNYKTVYDCLDDIVLEVVYFAQPVILSNILLIMQRYNLHYEFQPHQSGKHEAVLQWLMGNLNKIDSGEPVGWRSGPDSGKWPSDDPSDYKEVYNLLQTLIK